MKVVGRYFRVPVGLTTGFFLVMAGGAWLLYGIPFEDPLADWLLRGTLFITGLILLVLFRGRSQKFK